MSFDLEKIADYLQIKGFGTKGTDIVGFDFPTSPIKCVCIIPFDAGEKPAHTFGSSGTFVKSVEYPYVQIQVRDTTKSAAWNTLNLIRDSLDGASIDGIKSLILQSSCPENFEKGESVNYRFSCDFRLIV